MGLSLDLRHFAWSFANRDFIARLAAAIDAVDLFLIQELLAEVHDFPIWIPDAEPIDAGEWRTYERQCERLGMDAAQATAVLSILLHTTMQSEGSLYV